MTKAEKAYQQGVTDYRRGRPATANPYRASHDNELNLAWMKGWADA